MNAMCRATLLAIGLTLTRPAAGSATAADSALADSTSSAPAPADSAGLGEPADITPSPVAIPPVRRQQSIAGWIQTLRVGTFNASEQAGHLTNSSGAHLLDYQLSRRWPSGLEIGFELTSFGATFEGPPSTTIIGYLDTRRRLSNIGFGPTVRWARPMGLFRPYAETGISTNRMSVSADVLLYQFGNPYADSGKLGTSTEKVSSRTAHLSLGVDLAFSRGMSIGAEYRYMRLSGDFVELSGGDVDVADSFLSLVLRVHRVHRVRR